MRKDLDHRSPRDDAVTSLPAHVSVSNRSDDAGDGLTDGQEV